MQNNTTTFTPSLDSMVKQCGQLQQIPKSELRFGDLLGVRTRNSLYAIGVLQDGDYLVSGGWFDARNISPAKLSINGCTWGGSVIKADVAAACGLCIEFCNGLVTSPVQSFTVYRLRRDDLANVKPKLS